MSDTPTPEATPASSASVVIDRNAKVAVSRRPVFLAVAALVAFVAFTVVWFAVKSSDEYQPGPLAKGFISSLRDHGVGVDVTDDELRCIDDNGAGVSADFFDTETLDPLSEASGDQAQQAFVVALMDDCLERSSRIALLAGSMAEDGTIEPDQAECLAGKLDDFVVDAGGYSIMADDSDASAAGDLFGVIFGSMAECGIDFSALMGADGSED